MQSKSVKVSECEYKDGYGTGWSASKEDRIKANGLRRLKLLRVIRSEKESI